MNEGDEANGEWQDKPVGDEDTVLLIGIGIANVCLMVEIGWDADDDDDVCVCACACVCVADVVCGRSDVDFTSDLDDFFVLFGLLDEISTW